MTRRPVVCWFIVHTTYLGNHAISGLAFFSFNASACAVSVNVRKQKEEEEKKEENEREGGVVDAFVESASFLSLFSLSLFLSLFSFFFFFFFFRKCFLLCQCTG